MLYFFNVTVNGRTSSDTVGTQFDSFAGMQREAVRSVMAMAQDEATEVDREFEILVRNSGGPVYRTSLLLQCGLDPTNS